MADNEQVTKQPRPFYLKPRFIIGVVVVALVLIFVLQNREQATMHFLWLDFGTPIWVGFVIEVGLGFVIGYVVGKSRPHKD